MSRVLILGGYGVFGGRLARLLLRDGHEVIVAGRSRARAAAFCARHGGMPEAIDRDGALVLPPGLVALVDASGPFSTAGPDPYRVARGALAAGAHYFDLSDDAAFTAGIVELDGMARAAGRVALSGVSSVPALSAAAVRALAEGLERIDLIESAILPGNAAPRGRSVMASILSQAGEPLALTREGQRIEAVGWSEPAPLDLAPGLSRRAHLIGAPDLALFPGRFGARTVLFRAGLELWPMRAGLALMATARRYGLLPPLTRLLPVLLPLAQLLSPFGTDRGGMVVRVVGPREGRRVERRWHLVAERGEGPFCPAIPARALIRRLAALPPGARPCLDDLVLAEAEAAMTDLALRCETLPERGASLFDRVEGLDLATLPAPVRALHDVYDTALFEREARVQRGRGPPAWLACTLLRFPPEAERVPVTVRMTRDGDSETWTRRFGERTFRSVLRLDRGRMTARFGPATFTLDLTVAEGALHFPGVAGRIGWLSIPRVLPHVSRARERVDGGRACFDVDVSLPLGLGRVIRYRGWLARVA